MAPVLTASGERIVAEAVASEEAAWLPAREADAATGGAVTPEGRCRGARARRPAARYTGRASPAAVVPGGIGVRVLPPRASR